jgi:hypothetical protein
MLLETSMAEVKVVGTIISIMFAPPGVLSGPSYQ